MKKLIEEQTLMQVPALLLHKNRFNRFDPTKVTDFILTCDWYEIVDVVDTTFPFWLNSNDTLVIKLNEKDLNPIKFAMALYDMEPDEVDYLPTDKGNYVMRFWWD